MCVKLPNSEMIKMLARKDNPKKIFKNLSTFYVGLA